MNDEIGTVITTFNGPSSGNFSFVIKENGKTAPIHTGQFVQLKTEEGEIVGMILEMIKTNRYFNRAETVREYERGGHSLDSIFPIDRWEYMIATVKPLGIYKNNKLKRVTFPPSPGMKVFISKNDFLEKFLGLDNKCGLFLGTMNFHDLEASFNLTRLFQKHVALLAMSGAGKSYTTSVILEELLSRNVEDGRVGVIIIDVHGEYIGLSEKPENGEFKDFSEKIKVISSPFISFQTSLLGEGDFARYLPEMSSVQIRELGQVISSLKKEKKLYNISDIISKIDSNENIKNQTKEALKGWLYKLEKTGLFGESENPNLFKSIKPGQALIFDLSPTTSLKKKQMIVNYIATRCFYLRKKNAISPFVLILEEAHQFVPEGSKKELAISRSIIELYAREGRKFGSSLCVISQRPVKLSTTVLSQCGTHIILRITNPYDLEHIKETSEQITREALKMISTLPIGEALIVGNAVNFPIFVKIRQKKSNPKTKFLDLEESAKNYELIRNIKEN
ncbi:MAG: ATP-binding protein [Candidatus Helarchaeota archaeon]